MTIEEFENRPLTAEEQALWDEFVALSEEEQNEICQIIARNLEKRALYVAEHGTRLEVFRMKLELNRLWETVGFDKPFPGIDH